MNEKSSAQPEFTGWRANFWPIHSQELKKFLPLAFMMFCILFNYTLLRDTKDTLVVNTPAGASAITFLKLYCVTPCAVLFVIIYAKLTNTLSRENVFYAVITPFLLFFALFAFVLYPNLDVIHPSAETIASLQASYPRLQGFIDIYAYWSFSLFYVLAEIWGSAMIALMFWQFANHVVRVRESKRFYGLFAVIGNAALMFSGKFVKFCSKDLQNYFSSKDEAWQFSLYLMMGAVVVLGIVATVLYRWMHTSILTDKLYFDPSESGVPKKKKEKPSLGESFKIILKSPELGLIAILIMAYGVTINLVEVQWKHQLKLFAAGDKGTYNGFMGDFSFYTGLFTIAFGFLLGSSILRRVSWFISAIITPLTIACGGALFFIFIFAKDLAQGLLDTLGSSPISAATYLGAAIIIISKSIKYILFDSTKEMAYIPLDDELKTKGKAAVDVIGGRAGKAGGAFVQNMLFIAFATKDAVLIAPQAFAVFSVVCLLWFFSVKYLSKKVEAAVVRQKQSTH
jgi:AAA family ATP:ADP antiporter